MKFGIIQYDHLEFPGVVPRTFVGAIITAFICFPVRMILPALEASKIAMLYILRGVIGALSVISFGYLRRSVSRRFVSSLLLFDLSIHHVNTWLNDDDVCRLIGREKDEEKKFNRWIAVFFVRGFLSEDALLPVL